MSNDGVSGGGARCGGTSLETTIDTGLSSLELGRTTGSTDTEALRAGAGGGFALDLLRRPLLRDAVVLAVLKAGECVIGITGDSETEGGLFRGVFCSDGLREIGLGFADPFPEEVGCAVDVLIGARVGLERGAVGLVGAAATGLTTGAATGLTDGVAGGFEDFSLG